MKFLIKNSITDAIIRGDSLLVTKQLNGHWRAKGGLYLSYFHEAIKLRRRLPGVQIEWVRRENNTEADYLSRQAIKVAPRGVKQNKELIKLVRQQRADARDRKLRFEHAINK